MNVTFLSIITKRSRNETTEEKLEICQWLKESQFQWL